MDSSAWLMELLRRELVRIYGVDEFCVLEGIEWRSQAVPLDRCVMLIALVRGGLFLGFFMA